MSLQIISVSGPPGAGKSTLVNALAVELDAGVIQYDDYEVITSWPPEQVISWLDRGAPFDEAVAPKLYDMLANMDGFVLFETPFGPACPQTGPLIAFSIWLECAPDLALARKLAAFAALNTGRADFSQTLRGWLGAYESFTRRALDLQRERVRPLANMIVSSEVAPEKLVSSVFSSIIQALSS